MRTAKTRPKKKETRAPGSRVPLAERVSATMASLERHADKKVRDGMARYAIPSDKALGISVGTMRTLGKELGPDHELALALWKIDVYEARMMAVFVADPAELTAAQMERWCKDFDNWALCDTACFQLFDRTPHAFDKIEAWAERKPEFEKRAAFALLASLAGHDKRSEDEVYARYFRLIEAGAEDPRNFVKKAVSWALRRIGTRSPSLRKQALAVAQRLAKSENAAARWVGKDAVRDLSRVKKKKD